MASYKIAEFTFSASYTTGGESFDYRGLDQPGYVLLAFPKGGYLFEWDPVAKKIKAYYGDNNNAADGPLIEVAAAVNVGAIGPVTVLLLPKTN